MPMLLLAKCLPRESVHMKKRSSDKTKRLIDPSVDQARVLFFPDSSRNAYHAYSALYHAERPRASVKDFLKHGLLMVAWFAALTTFFVVQRTMLHHSLATSSMNKPELSSKIMAHHSL